MPAEVIENVFGAEAVVAAAEVIQFVNIPESITMKVGEAPVATIAAGTGYSAAIEWSFKGTSNTYYQVYSDTKFEYNKEYQAVITLTPCNISDSYSFAESVSVTIGGEAVNTGDIVKNSDGTLTITKTFEAIKIPPTAEHFTLNLNTSVVTAEEGMGKITTEHCATEPGIYTVSVSVEEGTLYAASTDDILVGTYCTPDVTAASDLTYTEENGAGKAQELITCNGTGKPEDQTVWYYPVKVNETDKTETPVLSADNWKNNALDVKAADAGTYKVYYTITDSLTTSCSADIKDCSFVVVTIAKAANKPSVTGGTNKITGTATDMEYSSNNSSWTECKGTSITGLSAGTYYVRYKETDNYNASECVTVKVTAYTPPTYTNSSVTKAPTANTLTYTGSAQTLITTGSASGGTIQYSLDNKTFSETIPTAKAAGEYTVYYKAVGDSNHNDT